MIIHRLFSDSSELVRAFTLLIHEHNKRAIAIVTLLMMSYDPYRSRCLPSGYFQAAKSFTARQHVFVTLYVIGHGAAAGTWMDDRPGFVAPKAHVPTCDTRVSDLPTKRKRVSTVVPNAHRIARAYCGQKEKC
uniref:Uncharacterized protein n=1 Tax=Sipha flava TaxID=143950 RepID=A0A2S2QL00_9HEMI